MRELLVFVFYKLFFFASFKKSDRDEIRRKLATDTDDDDYIPDYLKKGITSKSHLGS